MGVIKVVEEVLDKTYKKYAFLFVDNLEFRKTVKDVEDEYTSWSLDVANTWLFLAKLEKKMRSYLKDKLDNKPVEVLERYIEFNLKSKTKNYLEKLEDLIEFCKKNDVNLSDVLIEKLLDNSSTLENIVGNVVSLYMLYIKRGTLDTKIKDEKIREIIYIYCDLEKIEVNSAEVQSDCPYLSYSLPPFTDKQEEVEVLKRAKSGDKGAAEEIVLRVIKLVYAMAKRYVKNEISIEDLVQEGVEGVLVAIKLYNFQYDIKFSTYVYGWIRQRMSRYVITREHRFNSLAGINKLYTDYQRVYQEFYSEYDREPSLKEMADILKVPKEKLFMLLMASKQTLSLDEPLVADETSGLGDFLVDDSIDFVTVYEDKEYIDNLDKLFKRSSLTKREKDVIRLKLGLDGSGMMKTKAEVAILLGLTHQRVAQLEKKALEKIKNYGINGEKVPKRIKTQTKKRQ